jgi:hypothetical protein
MNRQGILGRIKRGMIAGFIGTGPMTGVMEAYRRGVPVTGKDPFIPREVAEGIARRGGFEEQVDEWGEPAWWGLTAASHFGFGGAAGAVYGAIEPLINRYRNRKNGTGRTVKVTEARHISRHLAQGAGFGLLVWATPYLGIFPAVGLVKPQGDKPIRSNAGLVLSHLVWGMTTSLVYDSLRRRAQSSAAAPRPTKRRRRIKQHA